MPASFLDIVERYIAEGQPVGSRALSKYSGLDLSPASIRNVMADLEDMGLIYSPHTSAGRLPTQSGLRLFVDFLSDPGFSHTWTLFGPNDNPVGKRVVMPWAEDMTAEVVGVVREVLRGSAAAGTRSTPCSRPVPTRSPASTTRPSTATAPSRRSRR